jgi:hypothetical protein
MALPAARSSVARGRPSREGAGMNGSINARFPSVVSPA